MQQHLGPRPHHLTWMLATVLGLVTALGLFILSVLNNSGYQLSRIPEASGHHQKLLNSVRDWQSFGFFQLGGFLTFTENGDYTGSFPTKLYSSHAPFYVFPHWLGYALRGEKGFYFVVVVLALLLAIAMSVCLAMLATRLLPQKLLDRFNLTVVATLAAVLSIPGEALWGTGFNNFDCTSAFLIYITGLTLITMGRSRPAFRAGAALVLVVAPLLAPRLGFGILISLILARFSVESQARGFLPQELGNLVRLRSILAVALMTSLHFLHIMVVKFWAGDRFIFRSGGGWMARMGFLAGTEGIGQGGYDYTSNLQTLTFIWRQSEYIQTFKSFPLNLDIEHVLFWGVGIGAALVLLFRLRDLPRQLILALIIAPGIVLSTVLNQSSAEHPDYYNIFWHPALVLGWTYAILCFLEWLSRLRQGLDLRLFAGAVILWSLFLWQIRYFLLAYFFVS